MVVKRSIDSVIAKSAHAKAGQEEDGKKDWTNFTLRVRNNMLREIDEALEKTVGLSKTGFILQAIQEKLRKEND